jgi:hypothetical protein
LSISDHLDAALRLERLAERETLAMSTSRLGYSIRCTIEGADSRFQATPRTQACLSPLSPRSLLRTGLGDVRSAETVSRDSENC